MKTLLTLLLLTLICVLRLGSAGPDATRALSQPGCCPNHTQIHIPKGKVRHVEHSPNHCNSRAIVVTTVCDKKFCIDPDWTWAKNLLDEFKKSKIRKTSPFAKHSNC